MTPLSGRAAGAGPGPRISLCLVVRDEEADVAECIRSAREAADEIVVVDTGSRDRTADIARAEGARVVSFDWCDDFSAARNRAIDEARGDWVLFLDADERLAPGSAATIRRAVARERALGYRIVVTSDVGGAAPQRTPIVRLFRRDPDLRYVRRIHESVNESLVAVARRRGLAVLDLDAGIAHHGYRPDRFAALRKRERNLRLHRLTVQDRPGDAYAWYRFGDELRAVDDRRAEEALRTSWRLLEEKSSAERRSHPWGPDVAAVLAFLRLRDGDAAGAEAVAMRGSETLGTTPNLLWVRACARKQQERFEEAEADFAALRALDGRTGEAPVQPGITGPLALLGLADCREARGDLAGAEHALREALALDERSSAAVVSLARVVARSGRAEEARSLLDAHLTQAPKDGVAWAWSGKLALEAGAPAVAAKRLAIAASAPDAPEWVLCDLAMALALSGDLGEARRAAGRVKAPERRAELERVLPSA